MNLSTYSKAVAGALVGGLTALSLAFTAGSDGGSAVTPSEWVTVALAVVIGTGIVYAAPANKSSDE